MTCPARISTSLSRLAISLLLAITATTAQAQGFLKYIPDTIPFFRGMAVSFDLVGAAQLMLSDHGQYEAALRVNLHDQYFPIVEIGIGSANHKTDENTYLSYKTRAPYFRIGVDFNIMKNKHTGNRIFAGLRYGQTSYKVDIDRQPYLDPVWQWPTSFSFTDEQCSMRWAEALMGIDAKVFGPLHLGWSARYRLRLKHDDGPAGGTWYVPGYGIQDTSSLGATFYVAIDI